MNDFIILEGCDGVGKSSIVNILVKNGYKTMHFDYDSNLSIKENMKKFYLITIIAILF